MLNSIKFKTKKIICCFVLCLGMLTSALLGINISNKDLEVLAQNTNKIVEDVTSSVFGSGYDFYVSSTSDSTVKPTGWKELESTGFNKDNIVRGVVNLESETTFDTEENETSKPNMPITDKDTENNKGYYKNLMINCHEGSGKYGYENSSSISLEENSFYSISVTVYTQKTEKTDNQEETDPRASIYLTGLVDEDHELYNKTKYEYFSTLGSWETYTFYVDTNEAKKVNLQLWLGSKDSLVGGAVFFNEVSILRYSEDAYENHISTLEDSNDDNINIISLRTENKEPVKNSSFEDSIDNWSVMAQGTSNPSDILCRSVDVNTFTNFADKTITAPGSNCAAGNQNALFMYNRIDTYQAIESEEFTIDKHSYYKLTFWAKSDCNVGNGATVKLVDKSEENPIDSASLTLSTTFSSTTNKFRNNWTKYTFYICGPAKGSKNITIQVCLGTSSSKTSGYVFVDDFKIEDINYTTYSSNSSNTNSTQFNLNNSTDKYTISNGNFDKVQNSVTDNKYPFIPSDWTKEGKTDTTTLSGIVNTDINSFKEISFDYVDPDDESIIYDYIEPVKPSPLPNEDSDDNNVLMIGSRAENNSQSYKSNSFTLSANSYYSLSFYVMTDYARNIENKNYGARVLVNTSTNTIFDYQNIHYNDNGWHKIEAKIKTGINDISPNINLIFDNTNGYVFFDKVELKTISEALYKDTQFEDGDTEYFRIDLSTTKFDNRTFNKNLVNGIDTPVNWTFNEEINELTSVGIISSNNSLITDIPTPDSSNKNFLYISSLHDVYYAYTSNETKNFDASTYYKITVTLLTRYIPVNEITDEIEYVGGASISLSDSSEILIKDINTNGIWETYTIYASFTEALSSKITLALGYTDENTYGEVLFDNVNISTLSEDEYLAEVVDCDPNKIATFINYTEPKEQEEEETTSTWENEVNWLILPSILTSLAIIIAIIGYYVKKININRKPRVKTNYDRRKTLDKDIDKREKIALRQEIISELRAELENIDKEIEEFNTLANKHLDEIKAQINLEKEELEKAKLELEIRKKEATAQREKQLKESAEFAQNKQAEKQYNNFLSKIDRQELALQKKISAKDVKIATASQVNKEKLSRYLERQEYIKQQIAKIEAEIEEIAREEEELWAEYKAAKADAKRRKAEYKAQVKSDKEKAKKQKEIQRINKSKNESTTEKPKKTSSTKKSSKKEDK